MSYHKNGRGQLIRDSDGIIRREVRELIKLKQKEDVRITIQDNLSPVKHKYNITIQTQTSHKYGSASSYLDGNIFNISDSVCGKIKA